MSKASDTSSATAQVVVVLAVVSDTTVRRLAGDREDLKPYWKFGKKLCGQQAYYLQVLLFTDFTNHRKKT